MVLVVIRVFAYKTPMPITDPEITWLSVGERMANGFALYKDIWTDLEPFSAIIYYLLDLCFGKSSFVYFIFSLLLVMFQSILLTNGLNANKVFKEPTILPALVYILFSSLFFDFYTLPPVLLGITFIIWAFNMICYQSRIMTGEDRFFYIGLLTGIGSLFYLPFTLFLIFALISLGFYSSTSLKKQMILVLAFFFPYTIILIYYFWTDNLGNYYEYAILPVLNSAPVFMIDLPTIIKILILPLLLLLAATGAIVVKGKYIHYQYKIIKITGLWLLAGLIAIIIEKSITPNLFIIFVPPLAFFTTHLFLISSKSKIISEISFLVMFGGILLISFYSLKKPDSYTKSHLIKAAPETLKDLQIKNKKIIVLGSKKEFYINNTLSGPYENWKLSSWQFSDLKKYENVSAIYEVMEINKPDFIIDQENRMEKISLLIPALQKQYQRIDTTIVYRRKL
jgi:hypothetical protein